MIRFDFSFRHAVSAAPNRRAGTTRRAARPRSAFSFIEVLFAVMILGIGFIMLAGIFPVAMKQTADTKDETIGAALGRSGANAIAAIPDLQRTTILPPSGECIALSDYMWNAVKGSQILSDDPRYAWIGLIRRDVISFAGQVPNSAQVVIIPVQVREQGQSRFGPADLVQSGTGVNAMGNLKALPIRVQLYEGEDDGAGMPDRAIITGTCAGAAAPGAVIVLRNGSDTGGRNAAGRAYRLGNPVNGSNSEFELLAGFDLNTLPGPDGNFNTGDDIKEETSMSVDAWIVGRGMAQPGTGNTTFSGDSMAIGVYTTFVNLR
jgi:type II secretory pathway pseudopilin PulG